MTACAIRHGETDWSLNGRHTGTTDIPLTDNGRRLGACWLGLPPEAGQHFLLDTGTLNILSYYRGVPALKTWNAPMAG